MVLVLWGFMSIFFFGADMASQGCKRTCHPRQCSSPDCRGTQLIRHGNDGSMLLKCIVFLKGVFPSLGLTSILRRHLLQSLIRFLNIYPCQIIWHKNNNNCSGAKVENTGTDNISSEERQFVGLHFYNLQ